MNGQRTKAVYAVMKQMCDDMGVEYDANDAEYALRFTAAGEGLHIPVTMRLYAENRVLVVMCDCPFTVPERGKDAVALATCMLNYALADGSFDFDYLRGRLRFRVTSSYYDSLLGKEAIYRMLSLAIVATDRYNEKMLSLAIGKLSIEAFAAECDARGML